MQILKKFANVTKVEKDFFSKKIYTGLEYDKYATDCSNSIKELERKVNFLSAEMKSMVEQLNEEQHSRQQAEQRLHNLEMKLQKLENFEEHNVEKKTISKKKVKLKKVRIKER